MPKTFKFLVILCLFLLAGFSAYAIYSNIHEESGSKSSVIEIKEVTLSEEDRTFFENRITDSDKRIIEASNDTERFDALLTKGHALLALGRLAEAADTYWLAVSVNRDDPGVFTALGNVYTEMSDLDEAKKSYQKAIELNSESPDLWLRYITFEDDKLGGSRDWVSSIYIDALKKTNNHVDIITSYARFFESRGEYQSAKEYWEKAVEANPANRSIYVGEIERLGEKIYQQNAVQ